MNDKDMIERYIYEVIKRVPQEGTNTRKKKSENTNQTSEIREEIRLELASLIEDMCDAEDCSVEEALEKLGAPYEFAKRYRGDNCYLIGPEYYDNYLWVLKIALVGIGISSLISAIVQGIVGSGNYIDFFIDFFTELLITFTSGICSIMTIVTIIFAVLERQKVKVSIKPEGKWTVNDLAKNIPAVKPWSPLALPPVPDKRAIIKRGDSVVSIIFITVFMALLLFAPQLFGYFGYDGERLQSIACVFNLTEWNTIAPVFCLFLFIGLTDEIIRLVTGYYCKPVMYSNIICNILQIAGAVILFKFMPLWNTEFATQLLNNTGIREFSSGDILRFWGSNMFDNILLAGICAISFIETGVTIYKTLKYT